MNNLERKQTMNKPTVFDCSLIELPKITDRRGNLTPVTSNVNLPFDIRVPVRILLKDKFKLAVYSFQKVQAFCDPLPGAFDLFSAVSCHNQPSVTFSGFSRIASRQSLIRAIRVVFSSISSRSSRIRYTVKIHPLFIFDNSLTCGYYT